MSNEKEVQEVPEKGTTTQKDGLGKRILAFVFGITAALMAFVSPASAYEASQTPIALGCVTSQAPEIIAMNGDLIVWALNLVASHPILFIMFMTSLMLIIFGTITGMFRRGRRRGR